MPPQITPEALHGVCEKLGFRKRVQTRETERAGLLALRAAVLMAAEGVCSLVGFGRCS